MCWWENSRDFCVVLYFVMIPVINTGSLKISDIYLSNSVSLCVFVSVPPPFWCLACSHSFLACASPSASPIISSLLNVVIIPFVLRSLHIIKPWNNLWNIQTFTGRKKIKHKKNKINHVFYETKLTALFPDTSLNH